MINGPVVGGFLIALVLVGAALFAGTWFANAISFQDAHTLDAARGTRPVVCSFSLRENDRRTTGHIHVRDGYMRFDIHDDDTGKITDWGVEINMRDTDRMMTRSAEGEPYVSLDNYSQLRVQVLENLKTIIQSESLHCAPWWSANGFRFALEGKFFN